MYSSNKVKLQDQTFLYVTPANFNNELNASYRVFNYF